MPPNQSDSQPTGPTGVVLPPRPVIYEINTLLWLRELSRRYGRPVTLGDVPAEVWDDLAGFRFNAIWFMGVWERSPAARAIVLENGIQRETMAEVLPDVTVDDIAGSPYAVRRYVVAASIGGPEGLAAARAELAARGVGVVLDFVPNHIALDHPWVTDHPEYFIHGTAEDLADSPHRFFRAGAMIYANGRNPYLTTWRDVAQLNVFHHGLRAAAIETLLDIAAQCDGLRCDMAMLTTTDVFQRTWGERAGEPPAQEYWREVLSAVREQYPTHCFIAEVYWDLEWELQQQGFDYCYDKPLYDRLVYESAESVRGHLGAESAYQDRLIRFIENHSEQRAADTFWAGRALAAAVAAYTLPGAKLFHQGQLEGYTVRLPVFLTRRPEQAADRALRAFYRRLTNAIQSPALRHGQWRLCAMSGWPDNTSYNNLAAWCWQAGEERRLIVVNLSNHTSQARVQLPWPELAGQTWVLEDIMEERVFEHSGDEILNMGLYVELAPWGRHFFAVR